MSTTAAKPGAEGTANAAPETTAATTATPATAAAPATPAVDANAERAAERARIAAITGHEAAKDRAGLANHLALNTNLSVEEAAKILAAAPTEKQEAAAPGKSAFEAAMETSDHPKVGADGGAAGEMTAAQRILASHALATGTKH